MSKTNTSKVKKDKKCFWCGKPLGEVYFTESKTKKSFHLALSGEDCLKSYLEHYKTVI